MSEGEETDEPSTGGDRSVPAAPQPLPHFAVVITGDGSAAIDGEPVEAAEGEAVDAAILDTLHRNARDRDTPVTAAISDPSAGYVAYVEVTPDGSSRLLDQQEPTEAQEEQPAPEPAPVPVEQALPAPEPVPLPVEDDLVDDDFGPADDFAHQHEEEEEEEEDEDDRNELPLAAGAGAGAGSAGGPPPMIIRRNDSRQSDDEYKSPGLLNRPFFVGPVALLVAALVIIPLVMLGSGGGDEKQSARSSSATSDIPSKKPRPTHSVSPIMVPPEPSTSPSPSAKPKPKPKHKKVDTEKTGAGVVTITARPPQATATVTAKPKQDTAATAVNRLAKNDPSGRHICYRAYVSGQGWQKPVCDGTMAGTSGRNLAIKAVNIAVHGVGGSGANAFVHNPKSTDGNGQWKTPWSPVTEGKDLYIGSSKRGAPNMSGFAINVGSGQVCQVARLHNAEWGGFGCADPRPNYIFGGTLRNDTYLEAVKFSV
ncbi:hypothetical protein [Streptomyces sp. NBC_00370]|uniref:hypothetical protein n=1 Tax=Streptomyces sp. NBC_00370 TaxID=2975728 RepID=UPI002E25C739